MSIILKGIDMPKEQIWGVEVVFRMEKDGSLYSITEMIEPTQVVEIPTPHGRLIDADKLKEKRETMCWKDEFYMTHESDFIDSRYIANAPTILEAEEGI